VATEDGPPTRDDSRSLVGFRTSPRTPKKLTYSGACYELVQLSMGISIFLHNHTWTRSVHGGENKIDCANRKMGEWMGWARTD
jgi:hypothetical protein